MVLRALDGEADRPIVLMVLLHPPEGDDPDESRPLAQPAPGYDWGPVPPHLPTDNQPGNSRLTANTAEASV